MGNTPHVPQQGSETVDSLAGRIKDKYPDYQSLDNHELVSKVITKYPEYQTHLSTEELQRLANPTATQPAEGSAWSRLASGVGAGAKALLPDLNPGAMLSNAVDMATGTAPLKMLGNAYGEYKHGRETGQGVIPSIAGAVGGAGGLDTEGIRERAGKGDIAGIVGEAIPAVGLTALGGESRRLKGVRGRIGNEYHDIETGKLTSGAVDMSRASGAVVGGAGGHLLHPGLGYPGAVAGGLAGPALMEKLFPEGAERVAKRAADAKYTSLGEDLMRRGEEQGKLDRVQAKAEKPARDFAAGKPGPFNRLSESPNRAEEIPNLNDLRPMGEGGRAPSFTGQDLISRTGALVKPGEEPTAADLKRAGDLTQAPLARLQLLKRFGDKLAENEINRRLKNQ